MSEYFILRHPVDPGDYCALGQLPEELPDPWMPSDGDRMGDIYGEAVDFPMSEKQRGIALADLVRNTLGYYVVSPALRAVLEDHGNADIEFLPIRILNHKGRLASDDYTIANVIGTVDCVDMERSQGRTNRREPGQFSRLQELHLDAERIPQDRPLFRIASMPPVLVVRDDLRKAIEEAGVTGADFFAMGEPVNIIA